MHKTFVGFLRVSLPPPWLINHQPNEGKRGWVGQRDLGDMGVVTGWPDLQIIGTGGTSYFIELKMPKGVISPAQKALAEKFQALGVNFALARTYAEAENALTNWQIPLSVTFTQYVAAWTTRNRLSQAEYCRFILGAAPPVQEPRPRGRKIVKAVKVIPATKASGLSAAATSSKKEPKSNDAAQVVPAKRRTRAA